MMVDQKNGSTVDMQDVDGGVFGNVIEAWAREKPDAVYCRFEGRAFTIDDINRAANRIANGLTAQGLVSGDRVGVMLSNHPDYVATIFALMKIGVVRVSINVHAKGRALQRFFEQFDLCALIAEAEFADELAPILASHPMQGVHWRGRAQAEGRDFAQLLDFPDESQATTLTDADHVLTLVMSSGTTGAPKGVMKSDRNLRAGPMTILRLTEAREGDVFLLWEPLHHSAGVGVLIAAVLGRMTVAMIRNFSASRFWDDARDLSATHIHYLGGVLPMLLKQPPRPGDKDHKVRVAWGGGCAPDIWRQFEDRFGVQIREGYGLSELITFITINTECRFGSIGRETPYFDIRLTDESGEVVGPGEVGEITARARHPGLRFLGYFQNEQASRESMRGEWFRTGDLARRDEDGFYYYAGRSKDVLRRRGINISAWEVEQIINDHALVEESALVGVPSELGDDDLKIFIRTSPGGRLDPLDLIKWCEPRMPYFQIPRYVAFIDEFPRTPTQRIQKKELSRSVENTWDLEASGYKIARKKDHAEAGTASHELAVGSGGS